MTRQSVRNIISINRFISYEFRRGCVVIKKKAINLVIPADYEPDLLALKKELYWNHSQAAMFRELLNIGIKAKVDELERRSNNAYEHETYDDHRT